MGNRWVVAKVRVGWLLGQQRSYGTGVQDCSASWGGGHTDLSLHQHSQAHVRAKLLQKCLIPCDPTGCSLPGSSVHGDSPSKNTRVGFHALLQGIFLTRRSNPCLLHLLYWQAGSLPLNHLGRQAEPPKIIYFSWSKITIYLKNHDSLSQGHPLSAMGEEISLHQWVFFFPIVICQYSKIFFYKKYNICNVQQSGMQ